MGPTAVNATYAAEPNDAIEGHGSDGERHRMSDRASQRTTPDQKKCAQRENCAVMTAFCIDKTTALTAQLRTDVPRPTPGTQEALIRVLRAGICGTDLAMMNSYKPGFNGALGHEFVGVVEQVGSGGRTSKWLGKRVVGEINIPCNDAAQCCACKTHLEGETTTGPHGPDSEIQYRNHCPHRQALGIVGRSGAFAEFITLPLDNLLVVPDSVSNSDATFTEPLAAAYRILEQRIIRPTDRVAVLGDGRLGLLVAEVIAVEKAAQHVTLVGKHPSKLALVHHVVDATVLYHTSKSSDEEPCFDEIYRDSFDVVIECTGTPSGIAIAVGIVQPHRGRIIMKSTCAVAKTEISSDTLRVAARKAVQIVGSRCGPFAPALAAIAEKRIDVGKYLTATYPLARSRDAVAHAQQRGVLKVQLDLSAPVS